MRVGWLLRVGMGVGVVAGVGAVPFMEFPRELVMDVNKGRAVQSVGILRVAHSLAHWCS